MTPRVEEMKPIPLGERRFRAARRTSGERDDYIHSRYYLSGVKKIAREEGEAADDYAERLLAQLQHSGYVDELIGGLLTPIEIEDLAWTPAIAAETAAYTKTLHEPRDKEQRNVILLTLLMDFLVAGLNSSSATGSSSNPAEAQPEAAAR